MAGIFLASPTAVAPPLVDLIERTGIADMTYTSAEGDVWDLLHGNSGVVLEPKGVRGLRMPPLKRYTSSSPALDGTAYRGMRVDEREVFWPLFVYSDGTSQEWIEHDRRLWDAFDPAKVGTWTVVHPNGERRTLSIRLLDDGDSAWDRDPSQVGWEAYGVRFVAEDPYWHGPAVVRSWASGTAVDFFNGGAAPPFRISDGASVSTATMSNPGDVDAWPVWTVFGPTTSVDLGLNEQVIEAHFPLPAGKALIVDTDPRQQTALDADAASVGGETIAIPTGVDLTGQLGAVDFAPIPPGQSVALSLTMAGSGTVQASLRPSYYRAT